MGDSHSQLGSPHTEASGITRCAFCRRTLLRNAKGAYGGGGHFITFTNHRGALGLGGLAEVHIQPRQPSPTASSLSYMCSHYPAVCCCNAPINFPLDILRAIYKSCRLSFVTSLMLGNNAAAAAASSSG